MRRMISNKGLRDAVVKELNSDSELSAKHISVRATDGAVTLGGHVMTIHEKHVALRAAQRVGAVRALADGLEVRDGAAIVHSSDTPADDKIAEEVAHLRDRGAPIPDSIRVHVRDAHVMLHGQVDTSSERNAAAKAVRDLPGVHAVVNLIKIRTPAESTGVDLERHVQAALGRMHDVSPRSIRVRTNGGTAYLDGHLPSLAALETAMHAAGTAPGITGVESRIVVGPLRGRSDPSTGAVDID